MEQVVLSPIHQGCISCSEIYSETIDQSSETAEDRLKTRKISLEIKEQRLEKNKKSSESILDLIMAKPTISAEIAMKIDMSARGVEKQIRKLREAGVIRRVGADYGGHWEIIEQHNRGL